MKAKNLIMLVFALLIAMTGCKKEQKKQKDIETKIDKQVVYPMPTPFEVMNILQEAMAPYRLDLNSNVNNASNYISEKSQALNLGIYSADLAYSVTYNQAQTTREILSTIKKLSDNLDITGVLDQKLMNRIEQNIDNSDSLYSLVNKTYIKTYNDFIQRGKGALAATVLAGAWIESLYLATQLAVTSSDSHPFQEKLAEQKLNVNSLLSIMKQYKDNPDVSSLIPDIQKVKEILDNVKQDEDDNFLPIDDNTFQELTTTVAQIRKKYVESK